MLKIKKNIEIINTIAPEHLEIILKIKRLIKKD